ncbi:Predicted DNA-binding transcriptional regulator YafY, contains an HTH and WYL domains [Nonomuraea solani]|uniref:Predicted DNA-binding transcriptional regulator YafY, contains an HTH and WYL domains n=1 Tax=Nonomuraea solani TaxID=1144553 RepID=A0A1H5ZQI0_9ACTN|nr:YafY family protein [Nonomuraea solani]SEG38462.1 Predicted DNA-binding transcriptional regulator YafY, contains an HTH and WYL domains [Nonomuraea solani]
MLETSARLLKLLSLLQAHRDWSGPELSTRLGVSTRTIRNDVERLRSLGYPVHATPGVAGGYRLGAGAALPPLLLDDEEAVAVAVGLGRAAGGGVEGIEETSVRALAKLEQVLPSRLRRRVNALNTYTVQIPGNAPSVAPEVLTTIANAARDHERLRFDYTGHGGEVSVRDVEPHRLVHRHGRWYLVGYDAERRDWRTFRVDRMRPRTPSGPRFTPRELPADGDVAAYVEKGVNTAMWRYRATVLLHAPAERMRALPLDLEIEAVDDTTCLLRLGGDDVNGMAVWIGFLGVDFEVLDPPELAEHVLTLSERYRRAVSGR